MEKFANFELMTLAAKKLTPGRRQVRGIILYSYAAFVWVWQVALRMIGDQNLLQKERRFLPTREPTPADWRKLMQQAVRRGADHSGGRNNPGPPSRYKKRARECQQP